MSADERIGTAERERLASDLALRGGRLRSSTSTGPT